MKGSMFLFLLIHFSVGVKADIPAMMNKIVTLRADLEARSREMEMDIKTKQAELDLWTQKRLELEGQIQKETLRKLQLDEKTNRLASQVKAHSKVDPKATDEFIAWLDRAEAWVHSSLPYRQSSRRDIIRALRARAQRGLESPEILAYELWQFYEGEIKMALDNEFRIIDVEDIGKAEVARLGLYTFFAKTTDGTIRQAVLTGNKWTLKPIDENSRQDAERLLENLKGKRDQGLYSLPAAQPTSLTEDHL